MKVVKFDSSNIDFIAHSPEDNLLQINFKNGGIYHYQNVDVALYFKAITSEAPSQFLRQHIINEKQKYPYQKVTKEQMISTGIMDPNMLDTLYPLADFNKPHYVLRFMLDTENEHVAEIISEDGPCTWRELLDQAMEWCEQNNICYSYLADNGVMQEGYKGQAVLFPDEAKLYIAGKGIAADSKSN